MSDTQNQWIPVSERLPEVRHVKLAYAESRNTYKAYLDELNVWWNAERPNECLTNVTHWMDLPAPPKPADPFEAWWESTDHCGTVRAAWNAAKEHYAKPLPDFETWWAGLYQNRGIHYLDKDGFAVAEPMAREIWNAAQGKPEA